MAYYKLSTFMISLVLVSMFAGIFGLFITYGATHYGIAENSSINYSKYNRLAELNQQAEGVKADTQTVEQQKGVFDFVGGFFSNAYKVLLGIPQSINFFNDMVEQAAIDSKMANEAGQGLTLIKTAILTIVIIIIFIGIFLSMLIRREV